MHEPLIHTKYYNLLNKRRKLHDNDLRIEDYWSKMVEVLAEDETETIALVEDMDKESFEWLSEIFEDVSFALKSRRFVDTLRNVCNKHETLNLLPFIDTAERTLDWDNL